MTTTDVDNPYRPPQSYSPVDGLELPVNPRDQLADLLTLWTAGQITTTKFRTDLNAFWGVEDDVIDFVLEVLPKSFQADATSISIRANRDRWNFIQRLILLLRSGYELKTMTSRRWTFWQLPATFALAGFIWSSLKFGLRETWVVTMGPLAISTAMLFWQREKYVQHQDFDPVFSPFRSVTDIEDAMRSAPEFRKLRFPGADSEFFSLQHDQPAATSQIHKTFGWLLIAVPWLAFSPLILLAQCLPVSSGSSFAIRPAKKGLLATLFGTDKAPADVQVTAGKQTTSDNHR